MSDYHTVPAATFRPDPEEHAPVASDLEGRGHSMTAFLRACLRWYFANPDAALATLEDHWPPPRPRGKQAHAKRTAKP